MREPVAFKKTDTSVRLLPMEALASSLNYHGLVNIDYMCKTTAMTEDEITEALKGEIFYNPMTDRWEHRGRFIGGDIVTKLKEVSDMLPLLDDRKRAYAEISAKALSEVIPEPVPYEELDINMGERWIDPKIYADFATHLFGVEAELMYFDINDTYVLRLKGYSPVAYNTYSVRNCNGEDMFVHALHDTVSCSRSVISSKGALMSVSGVRISCAVLTKKRIFSSDSFRCFLKTIIRRVMLAMDMIITA